MAIGAVLITTLFPMTSSPSHTGKSRSKAITGPQADPAFAAVAAPEIRHRVLLAHLVHRVRRFSEACIGRPIGGLLLKIWLHNWPGARWIEQLGLPRHNLTTLLGKDALTLHVNPRELFQFAMHPPRKVKKRPSSLAFIWDGDWDLRRNDLRAGFWIAHMRDLDHNRDHLERTEKYRSLMAEIDAGRPFHSHQEGVYLDSSERVIDYLKIYLGFLDNMAVNGYDESRAKDGLGVVISREGRILKVNRGLHRLAMAQWVGLPTVPVHVRHVHRQWWENVTHGVTGQQALDRVRDALALCTPEQERGPLSEEPPTEIPDDFWPRPR